MGAGDRDVSAELAAVRSTLDNGFKSLEVSLAFVASLADQNRRALDQVGERVSAIESRRSSVARKGD